MTVDTEKKARKAAYDRAWDADNPERRSAYYRAWYEEHGRAYREANKEHITACRHAWVERNRDRKAFLNHRGHAASRGVPFLMTFEEWWSIWEQSGHWSERGRRSGQYVMARFGDRGPYAAGNVKIILSEENRAEVEYDR